MPNFYTRRELDAIDREAQDLVDAAIREAGRLTQGGPNHERRVVKSERWFQWLWYLLDTAGGRFVVLSAGTAFTNAGAWRKVERAYAAELDAIEKERLEAQAAEIRERGR